MLTLLALARVLHLAGLVLATGTLACLALVVRPALGPSPPLGTVARRLALGGLAAALAGGALLLVLQAAAASGRTLPAALAPDALGALLVGTRLGRVWLVRLGLLALAAGLLAAGRQRTAALVCAAALASSALAGHAALADHPALLAWQLTADALHALAAGVWLGGLPLLGVALVEARRVGTRDALRAAARRVRRFSALGVVTVAVLTLSGVASAAALVGGFPALIGTPYGRLVLLKATLLLPMLGLAALNLVRERPRLEREAADGDPVGARRSVGRLARNVALETALGATALVAAGWLGALPPARHVDPLWPFGFRVDASRLDLAPEVRRQVGIALGVAVLGASTLAAAALLVRRRRGAVAAGGAAALGLGLLMLRPAWPVVAVDAYPTTYVRPAVPYLALSVASGLRLYAEHCAACHGALGYGDGPAAARLPKPPPRLTDPHVGEHTAGDIYWWLTRGVPGRAMPAFGDRTSEGERWDLINFLRTLAAAEEARPLGPAPGPDLRFPAPDFTFAADGGGVRSLRDLRGKAVALLVLYRMPGSRERMAALDRAYADLQRAGAEVVAAPLTGAAAAGDPRVSFPTAREALGPDGASDVAVAYAMFRRDLSPDGLRPDLPLPLHMEVLIDRQGYVRARQIRWLPGQGGPWDEPATLLETVARLAAEPPTARPPDEHVH